MRGCIIRCFPRPQASRLLLESGADVELTDSDGMSYTYYVICI
jgi:hypothetical protein